MSDDARLKVVLAWHMHQPQYKDLASGSYRLPWTYLHAIKDYTDMAAHLEAAPKARVVVNFAPILLEQIADYTAQIESFLHDGRGISDPLLAALAQPVMPASYEERVMLIRSCLRSHEARVVERFPAYQRLADMAPWAVTPGVMNYMRDQYLVDLLVWYHLAWLGETVRRTDISVKRLMEKQGGYTLNDRRELLDVMGGLLAGVIPRYARLADAGQVELSFTPYAHPIVPLLLDIDSAREAMPEATLPMAAYPGGVERARWHVREGLATFERHFGFRPVGCWPSEGGVSTAALALLGQEGVRWVATGEAVLAHSLSNGEQPLPEKENWLYQSWSAPQGDVRVFFRDDGLSDLIGFTYASWHADDAVADLIAHLVRIADACRDKPNAVVSIILDGENAWEHYPENGYYFLSALHRRLSEHPRLRMSTFSDCLPMEPKLLDRLVAGSWVYGTFSTWIGDTDKNRGWDMLTDAKRAYDANVGRLAPTQRELAARQLAVCEGSDWFWWFGDYNPQETVSDFERLYRVHLTNLYQLLRVAPPEYLAHVFTRGSGAPEHGGTMRHSHSG